MEGRHSALKEYVGRICHADDELRHEITGTLMDPPAAPVDERPTPDRGAIR
jgi:hypothetical protein